MALFFSFKCQFIRFRKHSFYHKPILIFFKEMLLLYIELFKDTITLVWCSPKWVSCAAFNSTDSAIVSLCVFCKISGKSLSAHIFILCHLLKQPLQHYWSVSSLWYAWNLMKYSHLFLMKMNGLWRKWKFDIFKKHYKRFPILCTSRREFLSLWFN